MQLNINRLNIIVWKSDRNYCRVSGCAGRRPDAWIAGNISLDHIQYGSLDTVIIAYTPTHVI